MLKISRFRSRAILLRGKSLFSLFLMIKFVKIPTASFVFAKASRLSFKLCPPSFNMIISCLSVANNGSGVGRESVGVALGVGVFEGETVSGEVFLLASHQPKPTKIITKAREAPVNRRRLFFRKLEPNSSPSSDSEEVSEISSVRSGEIVFEAEAEVSLRSSCWGKIRVTSESGRVGRFGGGETAIF